ncbi:SMP-30/gluconolaconase/LRE-like region-containing protein [Halogeometricum pallidum JCM 14848]|uniref:SMP-30/gluconolaconase/LRE-like region-containing protein n=1 Tax=Halogeometricum pallidum JCM 14848 TaxID=1227487 RepID=M0CZ94_HALPD|nr:SMP-30/gluconolactonase/LRE family protein [Halogeometricum pallidum]ELZ28520.1 SMP-30/gluconolaconase/LRE-like region-containing protein [Halogeometricum pallidum JCM 14848]
MALELVADYPCETGEGPVWHVDEEALYWVDIPNGLLYRYDPETDEHGLVREGNPVGGVTVQADGSLLLFGAGGAVDRWEAESETATRVATLGEAADTRFNDVIADPEGRVFCGTMPTEDRLGALYRLDRDAGFTRVVDEADIPNGMGFSPDWETFYFTVSEEETIYAFDYDVETGGLSNRSVFVDTGGEAGVPDGLTVDAAGDVWSARWNGGVLVRYSPAGEERERIEFPARKVSSAAFGGRSLDDLYVTTAGGDGRPDEGELAGSLFRYDPDASGTPAFRSRVGLD